MDRIIGAIIFGIVFFGCWNFFIDWYMKGVDGDAVKKDTDNTFHL